MYKKNDITSNFVGFTRLNYKTVTAEATAAQCGRYSPEVPPSQHNRSTITSYSLLSTLFIMNLM